jgi:hypothetical protein
MASYTNPASQALPLIGQIPSQTLPYLQPYANQGASSIPQLQEQYNQLLNNPGQKLNNIGSEFQQSPGFKFALEQALGANSRANAAGGMAGSPQHEQQAMELATNLGNQDYYNWMNHAMPLYNQGLQGEQGFYSGGFQSANSMADMIAQTLAQMGQTNYTGQQNMNQMQNQNQNAKYNLLGQGIGAASAFLPVIGKSPMIGKGINSLFGGGNQ